MCKGSAITIFVILFTLFLLYYEMDYEIGWLRILSKTSSFIAISTLSMSFVLSIRIRLIEVLFKGLDRAYIVHQILGRSSLFFMLMHPILLAASYGWDKDIMSIYFIPGKSLYHTLGLLSVITVIALVALTICFNYKYDIWLYTHRLMIFALPLAILHSIELGSEMEYEPLQYWVIFVSIVGMISYAYKVLLYNRIGSKSQFTIEGISYRGDITEMSLGPLEKCSDIKPGQFFFVRFPDIGGEMHPFSVSKIDKKQSLRFSIKRSGDYTSEKLLNLNIGDRATLYGPYGMFFEDAHSGQENVYFVAGGIGITPFLAYLNSFDGKGNKNIRLIWTVSNIEEAVYEQELEELQTSIEGFSYEIWLSKINGRLRAKDVFDLYGEDERGNLWVYICGPGNLNHALSADFYSMGIPASNIKVEYFTLK